MEENKGFEIKCLNCGSTNATHEKSIDYDWEENSFIDGYEFYCKNCGQYIQY